MQNVRQVPFFNYSKLFTSDEVEYIQLFTDVGRRGAFIAQKDLVEIEEGLKKYTGSPYALGVANGTDALIIALKPAGLEPGDEVIFASHTFVATAASIHYAGGIPVPVECGLDHMIDPDSVADAVTSRTRAIMPIQLNGRTADMDRRAAEMYPDAELQPIAAAALRELMPNFRDIPRPALSRVRFELSRYKPEAPYKLIAPLYPTISIPRSCDPFGIS